MQFLRQNWRHENDIADIRQDIYVRVYETACDEIPASVRGLVFTAARNLIIDRVRRSRIVPIEAAAEFGTLEVAADEPNADRTVIARDAQTPPDRSIKQPKISPTISISYWDLTTVGRLDRAIIYPKRPTILAFGKNKARATPL